MKATTIDHADFILTASGRRFDFRDIMSNEVQIEDIAHALSHICRFGGHVPRFYSVAQHSVIVSHMVPPEHTLDALLHDATEAYVQDLVRPAKQFCQDYMQLEQRIADLIDKTFDVWTGNPIVKIGDNMALYAEAMSFFGSVEGWGIDKYAFSHPVVEPIGPEKAKLMFLHRYFELTGKESA
jgi:hypothetical protein